MKLTVFIGCYNESSTILKAIDEAKSLNIDKEIIVIDNCSSDGTREILKGLKGDKSLQIIFHSRNMGAGYSAWEAMHMAKGEYFYGPGADLEYRMPDVYKMIEKMEKDNLDAVLGSRLLARGRVSRLRLIKERPFWLGTIIATFMINMLFGKKFSDVIGINLVKTGILRKFEHMAGSQAFTFQLVSKLCKNGYKIGEVPLWYKPRTHKEGKTIRAIDIFPALWAIVKVRFSLRD
jgi:glycosyltransferase involved in cell wall biosynthesis